jgi:hypothetical protein
MNKTRNERQMQREEELLRICMESSVEFETIKQLIEANKSHSPNSKKNYQFDLIKNILNKKFKNASK